MKDNGKLTIGVEISGVGIFLAHLNGLRLGTPSGDSSRVFKILPLNRKSQTMEGYLDFVASGILNPGHTIP